MPPLLASRLKWEKDFKDFPQICAKQDGGGYLVVNHYETGDGPFIINEYAWLWLNRDGSPTALTDLVYEKLLGKNSDAEARRLAYARYFAMLTELWRTSRKNAGVLHFCMLGYSREGGATCDNFIGVKRQIFEPHFKKYASDAFAPVGLMLDYFETPAKASSSMKLKVKFINDTYEDFKGTLQLSLCDSKGKVLFESRKPPSSDACGKGELSFELKIPDSAGKYKMCAKILETGTESRRTLVVEN